MSTFHRLGHMLSCGHNPEPPCTLRGTWRGDGGGRSYLPEGPSSGLLVATKGPWQGSPHLGRVQTACCNHTHDESAPRSCGCHTVHGLGSSSLFTTEMLRDLLTRTSLPHFLGRSANKQQDRQTGERALISFSAEPVLEILQ